MAGHAPRNRGTSGHGVPQRAPACPPVVPSVPRQLSLVCPSSPPIGGNGGTGPRRTRLFTASTCSQCSHIVLAGTIYGLQLDLEPTTLDDQGEYLALRDGVPTYDLWPDRTARRRHLEEIAHPERVPRHARHTCDSQYGQHPRPTPPPHAALDPDAPAPF